ncbi:MAG: TFIIB-type zinc ribbon-containing protein [Thermoplasmatota archaeon]
MGQYLFDPQYQRCPECGSSGIQIDPVRGEIVCMDCGIVISDSHIDHGPEWRDSDNAHPRSRTGPPSHKWNDGMAPTTEIGWKDRDYYGHVIPEKNRAQIYRLRKWQRRLRKYRTAQRNLLFGYSEIERLCIAKDLPVNVRELAKSIFTRASEKNMIQGRGIECMVAVSLYAACRTSNVPRTLNEIADDMTVSRKEIGRAFRKLSRELELSLSVTNPIDYISRFCSRLQLNGNNLSEAIDIVRKAEEIGYISGKDPAGVAASAIYIATLVTGQTRTQGEISEASGVTEVTIRKRYKELIAKLNIQIQNGHYYKNVK